MLRTWYLRQGWLARIGQPPRPLCPTRSHQLQVQVELLGYDLALRPCHRSCLTRLFPFAVCGSVKTIPSSCTGMPRHSPIRCSIDHIFQVNLKCQCSLMYTDVYRYSHIYADMHRYERHTSKNYKTQKHCLQIQASLYELVQQSAVKKQYTQAKTLAVSILAY